MDSAPSPPQDVVVTDVLDFPYSLNVTWAAPMDNGGRPILRYLLTVNATTLEAGAMDSHLVINSNEFLMPNTVYEYV